MRNSEGDKFTMPQRGPHISMNIFKGVGADMESKWDINSCTDARTYYNQVVGPQVEWLEHAHSVTQKNPSFHVSMLMEWSRHGESGREKYIYWCMYTFWPRSGNRSGMTAKHTLPHSDIHVSMLLCIRDGAEFRNQVGIYTCTDVCSHSIQVKGTQMRWMGNKNTATQEQPCFHVTMQTSLIWHWESGGHVYMSWCMYTF